MTPAEQKKTLAEWIAKGASNDDALAHAGYDAGTAAARMALSWLDTPAGKAEVKRASVSVRLSEVESSANRDRTDEDIIADLRDIYRMAVEAGDLKAALRALELEGKHRGTFADKIELSGKVDLVGIIAAARRRVALADNSDVVDAQATEKSEDPEWM